MTKHCRSFRRNPANPSTTFFWNDWDNEPGMRFCSLAAQGLWMKLLSVAARSREHGVVLIGEHASKVEDLPALLAAACGETPDVVRALIGELVTFRVASVDEEGRLYNRRMVAEAKLSDQRAAAGRASAEVRKRRQQTVNEGPNEPASKPSSTRGNKTASGPKAGNADDARSCADAAAHPGQQKASRPVGKAAGSSVSILSSGSSNDDPADAVAPPEPAKITFGDCLEFLLESGRSEKSARALLGRWRQGFGHAAIHNAVAQARIHATGNPVAYIDACLRRFPPDRAPPDRAPPPSAVRREVYQP